MSMMTTVMLDIESPSDTRLVELTLNGDRDAFGQIVARYQSPICALAYSACGNVARSEDLAQEVFVAAWRRLRELKEPAKLKSWLYAIARNLINTAFRQQTRNPLSAAEPLDEALEAREDSFSPSESVITKEEEAILWRVLEAMPAIYREPMVLFYRQEESIPELAEVLEISEEAVRQRLSRGRAMLNERVARVVETGLRRSGPSKAFGLGVLAALPVSSAKAGTVAGAAAGIQGAGAAHGTGVLGAFGSMASTAASLAGGAISLWARIRNTRSPRERRFAVQTTTGLLVWTLSFLIADGLLHATGILSMSTRLSNAVAWTLFWLGSFVPLVFFAIWRERRQRQIKFEEGTFVPLPAEWLFNLDPASKGYKAAIYGTLACLFFSMCGCFIPMAIHKGDHVLPPVLAALCIPGWLWAAGTVVRQPEKAGPVFVRVWWALALISLVVVNLRWSFWFGGGEMFGFPRRTAPGIINHLILLLFASIRLAWWLRRRLIPMPDIGRPVRLAVWTYGSILVCGLVLLAAVRHFEAHHPKAAAAAVQESRPGSANR